MITAVTLSITKERRGVRVPKKTSSFQGSPSDILAALTATNSKNPEISKSAAKIIIPSSKPITSK